jgi:SAM-dependent methyltransferase
MMDAPRVDEAELAADLRNLAWINRLLGGIGVIRAHLPTLFAAKTRRKRKREIDREGNRGRPVFLSAFAVSLLSRFRGEKSSLSPERRWLVLDVATGGGDIPRWVFRRCGGAVDLVAADMHPQMLELARRWSGRLPIRFVQCDARRLPFRDRSVDVVLCSLMLHHLTEADSVTALQELGRVTRRRLIVNDLRRSRIAYVLIWLITRFSRNRLTRYDSPVSVERAFTPVELAALAREAGLDRGGRFRVCRHPYYRMALVYEPDA